MGESREKVQVNHAKGVNFKERGTLGVAPKRDELAEEGIVAHSQLRQTEECIAFRNCVPALRVGGW